MWKAAFCALCSVPAPTTSVPVHPVPLRLIVRNCDALPLKTILLAASPRIFPPSVMSCDPARVSTPPAPRSTVPLGSSMPIVSLCPSSLKSPSVP